MEQSQFTPINGKRYINITARELLKTTGTTVFSSCNADNYPERLLRMSKNVSYKVLTKMDTRRD